MFKMIDTDNSGQISFEELKDGLKRFGATLNESEIYDLMQAVSNFIILLYILLNSMMLHCYTYIYLLGTLKKMLNSGYSHHHTC